MAVAVKEGQVLAVHCSDLAEVYGISTAMTLNLRKALALGCLYSEKHQRKPSATISGLRAFFK